MKLQKGFTLIELMVVIVIIGILSALAIPKMFGVSAKAKAAEAPGVIANYETLTSAYAQETGLTAASATIGFAEVSTNASSKWFVYDGTTAPGTITGTTMSAFGDCADMSVWTSGAYSVGDDAFVTAMTNTSTHMKPADPCGAYTPNF